MRRLWYQLICSLVIALGSILMGLPTAQSAVYAIGHGLPRCGTGHQTPGHPTRLRDIVAVAQAAGLHGSALVTAVAIAMAESGGDALSECYNSPQKPYCPEGSRDRGLWQINSCWHPEISDEQAFDPIRAAQAMVHISGNGTDWTPWHAYTSHAYEQYLSVATSQITVLNTQPSGGSGTGDVGTTFISLPFAGKASVTQGFGCGHNPNEFPFGSCDHFHSGVDYGLAEGTPVLAVADGHVVRAGWDPDGNETYHGGYGYSVVIDHGNHLSTLYGHLKSQPEVHQGDSVLAGQEIGRSGSTGNSSGPHLHFGVSQNGSWIDPQPLVSSVSTSTAAATPSQNNDSCGLDNIIGCIRMGLTSTVGTFITSISDGLGAAITAVLQPIAVMNIWTNTPALLTYQAHAVQVMWGASLAIADGLVGLWLMLLFLQRGRDGVTGRPIEPLGYVISHSISTILAANLSLILIGWYIEVANTVTDSIGLFGKGGVLEALIALVLGGLDVLGFAAIASTTGPIGWIILVTLPLLKLVILALLGLQMLRRLAMLNLCIITAPLGLMANIWENTRSWSKLWHTHFWPALLTQLLQVMLLHVGLEMTSDFAQVVAVAIKQAMAVHKTLDAGSPWLGLVSHNGVNPQTVSFAIVAAAALYIMQSLLGFTIMFVAFKVPRLLNNDLGHVMGMQKMSAGHLGKSLWKNPVLQPAAMAATASMWGMHTASKVDLAGKSLFGTPPLRFPGDDISTPSEQSSSSPSPALMMPEVVPGTMSNGIVYGGPKSSASSDDPLDAEFSVA